MAPVDVLLLGRSYGQEPVGTVLQNCQFVL